MSRYTYSNRHLFWPLCCLFFFDIRILITPYVSSIVSNISDAVICYACNDLPHPADCGNIVTCGSHEVIGFI